MVVSVHPSTGRKALRIALPDKVICSQKAHERIEAPRFEGTQLLYLIPLIHRYINTSRLYTEIFELFLLPLARAGDAEKDHSRL